MPFKKGGGHHKGRKSTRISLNLTQTPTSRTEPDVSDEEMANGDVDAEDTRDATPANDVEEEVATPIADEDEDEDDSPQITSIPRRRGKSGRPRGRASYAHASEIGEDEGSESGTPRRRRGRPPGTGTGRARGGFRGRRKGQQPEPPKQVIDKEGNTLDVENDEVLVDDDTEGDEKVDADGNLQGGREYRVRTFTILGKDDRLYMLSTEPARCCGFRDSYLFFTKHPKLYKVVVGEEEKKDLIDRDILPNSYKGRNIGVVTARSVFREFGARIIVGGRRVIDDYKVTEARMNGALEGEIVDPDDHVPDNRSEYNRNRYVAWFGASEVYRQHAGGATVPGKQGIAGKRRNNITLQNWQFMHAREASRYNSQMTALRKANLEGVYDSNTNMMHFPKIMQPTHATWEHVPPEQEVVAEKRLSNGLTNGLHLTNGDSVEHDHDHDRDMAMQVDQRPKSTLFTKVPPIIARNFVVVDTKYVAPPISNAGYPGPDGHVEDPTSGTNGLNSVSQDLINELPPDCRAAFEEARAAENDWKREWGTEAHSGQRGHLKIGFNGYPV